MSISALPDIIKELLCDEKVSQNEILCKKIFEIKPLDFSTLGLIDRDLLDEIKAITATGNDSIYFGSTLRDIKCVIREEHDHRWHEVFVKYKAPRQLVITSVNLPHSPLQDREFQDITEILSSFQSYINDLSAYFYSLERIDQLCTVMEPQNPSFKDDYRRIFLDDRTWLHVEVTSKGLATNIHLVGHSERWYKKFQSGLHTWDHDKDIVDNIMTVFDLSEFPVASHISLESGRTQTEKPTVEAPTCGICLCDQLPDNEGMPQLLCQNPTCGVYFHRDCLYQWLVACAGNRLLPFGVATGACPACLQSITCSEN